MLKVLLTGANGQVGQEIFELCQDAPWSDKVALIPLTRTALDITDAEQVTAQLAAVTPDWVINCAAYTAVDRAEEEPKQALVVNHLGTKNLALACQEQQVRLLHLSTDYVFPGEGSEPYREIDQTGAVNQYGHSKLLGEQAITEILSAHIILRVSWVFGKHGQNFVKTMQRLLTSRAQLSVINDQYGAPTPATAIAHTCLLIIDQIAQGVISDPFGIYHYAGSPDVSWYDFASYIASQLADAGYVPLAELVPITTAAYSSKTTRGLNSRLDCVKIMDKFAITRPAWQNYICSTLHLADG